jgi:hypothetical protein
VEIIHLERKFLGHVMYEEAAILQIEIAGFEDGDIFFILWTRGKP